MDKFYLMRKELNIARRFTDKAFTSDQFAELNEAEQDYIKRNSITIENYIFNKIKEKVNLQKTVKLDSRKKKNIEETVDKKIIQKIDSINKLKETAISTLTERFNQLSEANESNLKESQLESADTKLEKWYDKKLAKINEKYDSQIQEIKDSRNEQIFDLALKEIQKEAKSIIKEVLANPHAKYKNEFSKAIKNIYIDYMYSTIENTSGRTYRNNKIVDMTYAVLTHETTADKMLNPGGFDQQKKMGYMVAAFKNPANKYTWEKLQAMSISELKDACYTEKNLSFIDTHVQFYKQNSAAGQILGMFAVQKVAHAVLESNGYLLNVNAICKLGGRQPFTIAGMEFGGYMEFDMKYNNKNELIGKILGSLVASAADAVKDPILNLMNINGQTANVLNTLIRLGMSFENAALLLSNNAISEALEEYNTKNLTDFVRLNDIIEKRKQALADKYKIEEDSQINTEELTLNELINGLKSNLSEAEKAAIDYKVLKAYQRIQSIADAMRGPTYATRFNSISNAVGPLIIDNLIMEHKMQNFSEHILQRKTSYKTTAGTNIKLGDLIFNGEFEEVLTPELANKLIADGVLAQEYYNEPISISMDDIFNAHPILREFSKAPAIANELFGNMPANSKIFRNVLNFLDEDLQNIIYGDRKLLSTLSDFFQSYLLVASGVINSKDLKAFIEAFPKVFNDRGYKTKYADNPLIAAIKLDTIKVNKKTGQKRAVLKIDTTGMTPQQKEKLMSGWIDLHKVDPKLSESLFKYNFFRTGIGFSPKSFMGLVPVFVKEKLKGYNDTFKNLPTVDPELVIDQFIRNNWDNNKLVPRKKDLKYRTLSDTSIEITDAQGIKSIEKSPYIKIKIGNQDVMFKRRFLVEGRAIYDLVSPLGNNKEYLEISTDEIAVGLNTPTIAIEQNDNTDISENTPQQVDLDIPSEATPTIEEQQALSEDIIAAYMTKGRDKESAITKIKSFKDRTEADKAGWKSGIKGFLRNRYTELGIKFDEAKLEKDFKSMC